MVLVPAYSVLRGLLQVVLIRVAAREGIRGRNGDGDIDCPSYRNVVHLLAVCRHRRPDILLLTAHQILIAPALVASFP